MIWGVHKAQRIQTDGTQVKKWRRYEMQSRTNVHFLVFHLTLADAIVSFITMPMETIWRVVIEVYNHHKKAPKNNCKSLQNVSVVCGEFCVQGADDGSHWWLHPLLTYAYCSFHWQVVSMMIFMTNMMMMMMRMIIYDDHGYDYDHDDDEKLAKLIEDA